MVRLFGWERIRNMIKNVILGILAWMLVGCAGLDSFILEGRMDRLESDFNKLEKRMDRKVDSVKALFYEIKSGPGQF